MPINNEKHLYKNLEIMLDISRSKQLTSAILYCTLVCVLSVGLMLYSVFTVEHDLKQYIDRQHEHTQGIIMHEKCKGQNNG